MIYFLCGLEERHLMFKRAFTFIELMVVIIILGVCVTAAMSGHGRLTEKNRGKIGILSIVAIENAQMRYKLDNGGYFYCVSADPETCLEEINTNLGLSIVDPYFNYTLVNDGVGSYTVTATRNVSTGHCPDKTITFTGGEAAMQTDCDFWKTSLVVFE